MRTIDMSEWDRFGEGGEATSYYHKTNPSIMLKLFDMGYGKSDAEPIARLTQEVLDMGIPTPAVVESVVDEAGHAGIVFERIQDKISLFRRNINFPETLEENARLFGEFLRKIHDTPCTSAIVPKRIDYPGGAIQYMVSANPTLTDEQKGQVIEAASQLLEITRAADKRSMCLMGDCHTGNVILSGDKLYLIDLGSFSCGDPLIELGYFWRGFTTPYTTDIIKPDEVMSAEDREVFWDTFARAYWQTDDVDVIAANTAEIAPLGKYLDVLICLYSGADYDTLLKACEPL